MRPFFFALMLSRGLTLWNMPLCQVGLGKAAILLLGAKLFHRVDSVLNTAKIDFSTLRVGVLTVN